MRACGCLFQAWRRSSSSESSSEASGKPQHEQLPSRPATARGMFSAAQLEAYRQLFDRMLPDAEGRITAAEVLRVHCSSYMRTPGTNAADRLVIKQYLDELAKEQNVEMPRRVGVLDANGEDPEEEVVELRTTGFARLITELTKLNFDQYLNMHWRAYCTARERCNEASNTAAGLDDSCI